MNHHTPDVAEVAVPAVFPPIEGLEFVPEHGAQDVFEPYRIA